jgi:predicted dehydrogenase
VTDRIRVAVAGLGAIAQSVHLPLLARRRDLFEVAAVCDLSASLRDSVGGQYGVAAAERFADVDEMVTKASPDGVILLTSGSHAPAALQAIRSAVPVFCEKPLAYTEAEAQTLADAETALGRPALLLGYMKERDAAVGRLADLLAEITDVRAVEVRVLHPTGESQLAFANLLPPPTDIPAEAVAELGRHEDRLLDAALGSGTPERFRRLYAGTVLGSLVHDTSLLRALFGGLSAVDDVRVWPDDAFPPSVDVTGVLASGPRATMAWHFLPDYPAYEETLTVHHGRGSMRVTFGTPYVLNAPTTLEVVEAADGASVKRSTYSSVTSSFENELVEFHAMVTAATPPRAGVGEGRADIVTSQRIMRKLADRLDVAVGGEVATR